MIGKILYNVYGTYSATTLSNLSGCFPAVAPIESELPFMVYEVVDIEPTPTKDSPTSALDIVTVNISFFDKSINNANQYSQAYKGYLDALTPGVIATVKMQSCRFQSEEEDYHDELEAHLNTIQYKFRIQK